jgi:hypothetical protein
MRSTLSFAIPLAAALLAATLPAGCGKASAPAPVDPDTNATAREAARHHELRDAVEGGQYKEKAEAAGDAAIEADKQREQAIKDAGG